MYLLEMRPQRVSVKKNSRFRTLAGTLSLLVWLIFDGLFLYSVFTSVPAGERFLLIVPYFVLTLYFQIGALIKGIKAVDDFLMWEIKTAPPPRVKTSFLGVTPPPSLKKRVEALKKELVQNDTLPSKNVEKPTTPVMPDVKLTKEEIEYLYN